ncbi:clpB2, partial [Symbiodinium necroappetens]
VILFIDEIHMALGAGETEKGSSMDAANLLKPALARGELRCIGATTTAEYKRLIQNQDKAFERRFVIVELFEPSEEAAEEMLQAMRPVF